VARIAPRELLRVEALHLLQLGGVPLLGCSDLSGVPHAKLLDLLGVDGLVGAAGHLGRSEALRARKNGKPPVLPRVLAQPLLQADELCFPRVAGVIHLDAHAQLVGALAAHQLRVVLLRARRGELVP